jgi:hypothetical protein
VVLYLKTPGIHVVEEFETLRQLSSDQQQCCPSNLQALKFLQTLLVNTLYINTRGVGKLQRPEGAVSLFFHSKRKAFSIYFWSFWLPLQGGKLWKRLKSSAPHP